MVVPQSDNSVHMGWSLSGGVLHLDEESIAETCQQEDEYNT